MTETPIATMTPELSTQDVRALKHADALCFDHLPDGTGRIRAIVRADRSSNGFEQTHEIQAVFSRIDDYEGTRAGETALARDEAYTYSGFYMSTSARFDPVVATLVRRLKVGSTFGFKWVRDNRSPVTERAGVVVDYLTLRVQSRNASIADEYLVATYVGLDNTARMVRRTR